MKRAVAVVGLALALFAGVASSAGARPATRYPASFERAFMSSCTQGRAELKPMCRCALAWLERRYSYQRLVSIYRNEPARFRRVAVAAVKACLR